MKMLKAGIAKSVPAAKVDEYKAAGWVELKPESVPKAEKPKAGAKKEA